MKTLQPMMKPLLSVRGLNLRIGDHVIHENLSFDVVYGGMTALMGPTGTGKSSLLSWLCGAFKPGYFTASWDLAEYDGAPLADGNRPVLIHQKAARTADEAVVLMQRALDSGARMICVDEVTARLRPTDCEIVLDMLMSIAQERSVFMVSHNQLQVAAYADTVLLVAGGRAHEHTQANRFFVAPTSDVGRQFLRTGGAMTPNPGADPRHLRSDLRGTPPGMRLKYELDDPRAPVRWVVDGRLGLLRTGSADKPAAKHYAELARSGITTVVSVSETSPPDFPALSEAGLVGVWHPIYRDEERSVSGSVPLCLECSRLLNDGQSIVVIGEPDTTNAERVLAAQLVFMGLAAEKAVNLAQGLVHEGKFGIDDEQFLWDLELTLDLDEKTVGRRRRRATAGHHARLNGAMRGPMEWVEARV